MTRLPCFRDVSIVLPAATLRLLCERARELWGPRAFEESDARRTTVLLRPQRFGLKSVAASPNGAFLIRWDSPNVGLGTITRISWSEREGSEDEVRLAINALVGWPVASRSLARSA